MPTADLALTELLDFAPGRISLRDRRMLLWDADAFGSLRRELIDGLGLDAARGILRRFGFANGYRDALTMRSFVPEASDRDWWLTCPALQAHQGKVRPEVVQLAVDRERGEFALEVHWHGSYEAEQHARVLGPAAAPSCWTLAGYASGFSTAVLGREVFVIEQECRALGHERCRVLGRPREAWGAEADAIAVEYQAPALARELSARDAELRATAEGEVAAAPPSPVDGVAAALSARSRGMLRVLDLIARVAPVDATVLIAGESGVGKERIARLIHQQSARAAGPFIAVNCGAMPEPLLESELFGHVRGAFTGATTDKPGLFAAARGGTVFLDEIGEMTAATQVKLLRVLQEREVRPVGATASTAIDVRVVAATHRRLADEVAAGRFRQDLYYRLKVVPVEVPPLRERREEILPLARHFLAKTCAAYKLPTRLLSPEVAAVLTSYPWPGNVRELEHAIEHAVVVAGDDGKLAVAHLPAELRERGADPAAALTAGELTLAELERRYTLVVLERNRGSRAATARALGIGTNTLWRKLKAWGVSGGDD
jgi:two-component system response regulator HydG